MIPHFGSLLGAVIPVFVVIAAGFLARRVGWLTPEADASLLRFVVNLLYPCLILDSVLGNPALEKIGNVLLPPVVGAFTIFLGYALGILGARVLRLGDAKEARTFAYAAGIYNYGYIAIPLVQAFFSRETMGVLFTHNLGVEMAFWIGANFILSPPSARGDWTKMLNPPVIAIIASVALNFGGAHEWTPRFILAAAHMLGVSAVPLALILTGATLADLLRTIPLRSGYSIYIGGAIIRSGLLPLLFLLLASLLPCSVELKQIIIVQAAMPAAMLPIVIARHYGGDASTALKIVLSTSLIGIVTIPFWLRLGLQWVGL